MARGEGEEASLRTPPLERCRLVSLPRIADERGTLTVVEGSREIPFDIARVFYIYDVAAGAARARHGHRTLEQFIIAVSGSFTLTVSDPFESKRFDLRRGFDGVYVPPLLWSDLEDFSTGAVALVLASAHFDAADYFDTPEEYHDLYGIEFPDHRR